MQFLSFPIEVRLGIYSELLVQQSPIEFRADRGPCSPRLTRTGKQGLNPGLLRVNKTVNREATPHLYSNNRFRFPDAHVSIDRYLEGPYIAPFLRQIGTNAGLLRHICINFPTSFAPPHSGKPVLYREHIQLFQLIQETCTGLKIVEISCMPPDRIFSVDDVDLAAEMLETLDNSGFHAMPSLETIVVVLGEYTIDEEVLACRDALMQRMPSCKWFVELIKVPPRPRVLQQPIYPNLVVLMPPNTAGDNNPVWEQPTEVTSPPLTFFSGTGTATEQLALTTPFEERRRCWSKWRRREVPASGRRTMAVLMSEPVSSCYPSGWDDAVPESRLHFSPAVCPSGWVYHSMGEQAAEVSTAICCESGYTWGDFRGYDLITSMVPSEWHCGRWVKNIDTRAPENMARNTAADETLFLHPAWFVSWGASDTSTLTPQLPTLTSGRMVPTWTPGQEIPDRKYNDSSRDDGPFGTPLLQFIMIGIPIIAVAFIAIGITCCVRHSRWKARKRAFEMSMQARPHVPKLDGRKAFNLPAFVDRNGRQSDPAVAGAATATGPPGPESGGGAVTGLAK
ncbi:hypothetical protein ACJZ2D_009164 [Fusarium nematophilum]